jgi:hypothetical protein
MYQLKCFECGQKLSAGAKRCSCGWQKAEVQTQRMADHRCQYTINQRRCPLPGTMCPYPYGDGPWYCSGHWGVQDDPRLGEAVLVDAEKNYNQIMADRTDWRKKLFTN